MTKRFLVVMSFTCLLGFASAVMAQQKAAVVRLRPNTPDAFQQEINAIQKLGGFLPNVIDLQSQGFLDGATANSLQSSTWSMIDTLASLSIAVGCQSVTDLISEVNASGLKLGTTRTLVSLLNKVQGNINQAQADLKQGDSAGALRNQLQAIQELAMFIGSVNSLQQRGVLDGPTADALEACALNLVSATHASASAGGLVASYAFNGDANDSSGSANNGTVVGASFQTYGAGSKRALNFEGSTSSYVIVPESASLEPANALTISMWVNGVPGESCGNGWGTILRKANNCAPGYFIRGCNGGTGFQLDGPDPCTSSSSTSVGFLPFTGTSWQHIVGTYSRADGVEKT